MFIYDPTSDMKIGCHILFEMLISDLRRDCTFDIFEIYGFESRKKPPIKISPSIASVLC